nr:protein kinase domain, nitrogen network kinase 1, phloem protein 2-like protein [Tanacetum cinerariifolium]
SPETPIIGQKPHNPLNRHKVYAVPRQRKDGWMEVKVGQLQTPSSTDTVRLAIDLRSPTWDKMYGLLIESIELRPVGTHSHRVIKSWVSEMQQSHKTMIWKLTEPKSWPPYQQREKYQSHPYMRLYLGAN